MACADFTAQSKKEMNPPEVQAEAAAMEIIITLNGALARSVAVDSLYAAPSFKNSATPKITEIILRHFQPLAPTPARAVEGQTPRTKEESNRVRRAGVDWHHSAQLMADFARTLERENAALLAENAEITRENEVLCQSNKVYERDFPQMSFEIEQLKKENAELRTALESERANIVHELRAGDALPPNK